MFFTYLVFLTSLFIILMTMTLKNKIGVNIQTPLKTIVSKASLLGVLV